jgi:hypothetical protein
MDINDQNHPDIRVAFYASRSEPDGCILAITQYGKCVRLNRSAATVLNLLKSGRPHAELCIRLGVEYRLSASEASEALSAAITKLGMAGFFAEADR